MEQSKSSKIFLAVFLLAVVLSMAVSYWRIIIKRDYSIVASVDCDPYAEQCFVHVCNPDPDVDGDACKGNAVDDTWFTKNINRMAYNIPDCDPTDKSCTALQCGENEAGCSYDSCSEATVPEGDSCNDPVQYTKDNPVVAEDAEAATCTEGDAECAAAVKDEAADASTCDASTGTVCPATGETQE